VTDLARALRVLPTDIVPAGTVNGVVCGISERPLGYRAGGGEQPLLSFRIERADARGAPLPAVLVEVPGVGMDDGLAEGDHVEVEVPERLKPGQVLQARQVRNLSTGATFAIEPVAALFQIIGVMATIVTIVALALGYVEFAL
jgi:hypothetical protein